MTADMTLHICNQCNKEFKYESEKRRHENSHFPQFQCKICSKHFSFISALRRHEKQHERTGAVTCNECRKEFRDGTLLKRHIKYAHGGSFICTKCNTVFNSEPALRTHMQTHKLESEKRYQCSYNGCSKKFNFAHHLKHHELTHSNKKQHFCKICGKGFIQLHHLKTHLRTHSDDEGLHCTVSECKRTFATEYARKRHVTKCHTKTDGGVSSDSNSPCDSPTHSSLAKSTSYDSNKGRFSETTIEETNETSESFNQHMLCQHIDEDLTKSNTNYREKIVDDTDNNISDEISNCKSAVGDCIMKEENEKCLCEQITKTVNNNYDFIPIETDTINFNTLSINTNDCASAECCGGKCDKENDFVKDDISVIEYKIDGTVKIKNFLDIDNITNDNNNKSNENKIIPYNSCKSVLGNCIVSGNGTIGDGCLCARMAIDDQVTAQEIEDITPHPKEGLTFVI